ncbi:hypothetical protein HanIR_Chr03g0123761 [Helianthus annuus]|nr:hypothetical protein HanIR_Chr03g0123761 [Helianthus annuus]
MSFPFKISSSLTFFTVQFIDLAFFFLDKGEHFFSGGSCGRSKWRRRCCVAIRMEVVVWCGGSGRRRCDGVMDLDGGGDV